jgi:Domain of unknown function (DUF4139)/N-terminal domain of unknown function (DUF4140)
MRQILFFAVMFLSLNVKAQTKKNIESKIDKVTVFLEGAQVQRSVKTSLAAGKSELVFTAISPFLDKQSIQVKADDNVTVLSVIHQQNFLKEQQKQDEIKELEAQKETQIEKLLLQRNIMNVYKQEETMLIKNQQIGGANNGLKAIDLKEAADFQRARLTEVYQKQMETDRAIKKMETELGKINKQLRELNQKADISTSEIHVTVTTKETVNSNFTVTYLVKQAGWFPTYDIRVKDINSPISLQYKANLFQSSGEDWKEVKLFLSTGNPNESGTKPVVTPWYLKYTYAYQPVSNTIQGITAARTISGRITDDKGNPVPGASVLVKGTSNGTAADANGFFTLNMPAGNNIVQVSAVGMTVQDKIVSGGYADINLKADEKSLSEVVVTGYSSNRDGWSDEEDNKSAKKYSSAAMQKISAKDIERSQNTITAIAYQPTTTVYEIKEPYTLLNDGKTYMADIDGYEMKAQYEYFAAPKVAPDAFLTAKITDWQELNLLPGEANLFFEGTFLGKSLLDVSNAGDTLNLSLGKDKGVVVKRTLLKEYSSKKFIGSNKTDTRQYEIVVRNNKQQPINIIVEDQLPISTQKEIEVQDRKYEGAKLDDDTQKLSWQIAVDPKKENKVNFRYEVKYPKDKTLVLE